MEYRTIEEKYQKKFGAIIFKDGYGHTRAAYRLSMEATQREFIDGKFVRVSKPGELIQEIIRFNSKRLQQDLDGLCGSPITMERDDHWTRKTTVISIPERPARVIESKKVNLRTFEIEDSVIEF